MSKLFDFIVVTAPSEYIAEGYKRQLQSLKSQLLCSKDSLIYCVADPAGKRVGSGGGTLNALDYLVSIHGEDVVKNARICIVHSGGDSRRSPLHTICGKAWATLNITVEHPGQGEQPSEPGYSHPLSVVINELVSFCRDIPTSTLVIACSDILIRIMKVISSYKSYIYNYNLTITVCIQDRDRQVQFPRDSICIVSIPEKVSTAKNHVSLYMLIHRCVYVYIVKYTNTSILHV